MNAHCSIILLAAGKGTRYGDIKQDLLFHGKQLWQFPYETACDVVGKENVVVVGKDIPGGETRTKSLINGLNALPKDTDRVIVIEAARPMITREQLTQAKEDPHPCTTFVRPLVNTPVYRDGRYVDREKLYEMVGVEAVDYKLLVEAYNSGCVENVTDTTRAVCEYHGIKPHFIETEGNLYKVTYPGDIAIIEAIYQRQQEKHSNL